MPSSLIPSVLLTTYLVRGFLAGGPSQSAGALGIEATEDPRRAGMREGMLGGMPGLIAVLAE